MTTLRRGFVAFCLLNLLTLPALAQKAGGHSLGFSIALMSPSQGDVNSWIDSVGAAGTKNVGAAYEVMADYEYRFSSTMFSMMFRPSYFTQSASGGGVSAKLTGLTFFPMFRLYPLENNFIRFFMQAGLGYGRLSTDLENGSASGTFDGSTFGAIGGLGAAFCFTPSHCMVIEGNVRYLPIERNTGKANAALGGNITQYDGELEMNGKDLGTTLSGVQGVLGYKLTF